MLPLRSTLPVGRSLLDLCVFAYPKLTLSAPRRIASSFVFDCKAAATCVNWRCYSLRRADGTQDVYSTSRSVMLSNTRSSHARGLQVRSMLQGQSPQRTGGRQSVAGWMWSPSAPLQGTLFEIGLVSPSDASISLQAAEDGLCAELGWASEPARAAAVPAGGPATLQTDGGAVPGAGSLGGPPKQAGLPGARSR